MNKIDMQQELIRMEKEGLTRHVHPLSMYKGKYFFNKQRILNFSSNDYLNLSENRKVKRVAIEAIKSYKCGASSSALVSGYFDIHCKLENSLALLLGQKEAIVWGSGFLANFGILKAIASKDDNIYVDRLVHASLVDGCLLSRANLFRYKHNDQNHLEELIKKSSGKGKKIIVTESVFSMDGDIAPIKDILQIAEKYNALLIVDEAHALGVFGKTGGGICQDLKTNRKPDIIVGTLSKALGSYGGFTACSSIVKKYLINKARSYIYSTALPPVCAAAALASLNLIRKDSKKLGSKTIKKAKLFHKLLTGSGFNMQPFNSQIIPLHIGDNKKAVDLSKMLLEQYGILTPAIRPPTVPAGTARLRLSITLGHSSKDLSYAINAISRSAKELNIL